MDQATQRFYNLYTGSNRNFRNFTFDDFRNVDTIQLLGLRSIIQGDNVADLAQFRPTNMSNGDFQLAVLSAIGARNPELLTQSYAARIYDRIEAAEMMFNVIPSNQSDDIANEALRLGRAAIENPAQTPAFIRYVEQNGGTRANAEAFQELMVMLRSNLRAEADIRHSTINFFPINGSVLGSRVVGNSTVVEPLTMAEGTVWSQLLQAVDRGSEPFHAMLRPDRMVFPVEYVNALLSRPGQPPVDLIAFYTEMFERQGMAPDVAARRAQAQYNVLFGVPTNDANLIDLGFTVGALPEFTTDIVALDPSGLRPVINGAAGIVLDAGTAGQEARYTDQDIVLSSVLVARMLSRGGFDDTTRDDIDWSNLGNLPPIPERRAVNDNGQDEVLARAG